MTTTTKGDYSLLLVSLAAILALLMGIEVSTIKHKLELDWSDWLGFAGALVGGAATVVAAVIAWKAVRNQNEININLAKRREVESRKLAISLVKPHLETIAACWLVFDIAETRNEEQKQRGIASGTAFFFEADVKNDLEEIDGLGPSLSPSDAWDFRHLILQMKLFSSLCSNIFAPSIFDNRIENLRARLTRICDAAVRFDPELAIIFRDLKRTEAIRTTSAALLRDKALHYERTGNIDVDIIPLPPP
ncbi:hypothetical protein G8O24_41740 [Bradyrhizobium sp. INPA01-394B]|uniref:Phage abortive infection protein n=1 Tax=Bradyrhizobium campsiandrae TaxID=1729892 RepID=A0ABR7U9M7_9BRAD|nr:hypothetical protein [Bradyrhizobium campsiandrae]MBC9883800.1 hypothetical protein [Bradyrhizobium campsiandrae]MBC9980206.1 hypothetical protein [Bradyrhizobium campsiandrae]